MTSDQYYTPLAPWYRFIPTDQDLLTYFLKKKRSGDPLPLNEIIEELQFYDYTPEQLSEMYGLAGQTELYFFTNSDVPKVRKRKANGFWKSISRYEDIKEGNEIIGCKRSLRFSEGSSRKDSTNTNWYMVEYKIGVYGWVCCKVYQQRLNPKKVSYPGKKRRCLSKNLSELPYEIVVEILSWLPVKSLMKFKCVCKQWCSMIDQDYKFKAKHMDRSSLIQVSFNYKWEANKNVVHIMDENFILISFFSGLYLEQSSSTPKVFRIRNPSMHKVVYLPDAHEEGITRSRVIGFAFNSVTGECKVACFYTKLLQGSLGIEVGFEVLTIGIDQQWRPLKLPNQNNKLVLRRLPFGPYKVEGVAHLVEVIRDGQDLYLEVQSFDVWSECFTTTTLPRGVFLDLEKVHVFRWNHCIAVAEIAKESLNFLVLEKFREQKWSKNQIIVPLKFLKDNPQWKDNIYPISAGNDRIDLQDGVPSNILYLGHSGARKCRLSYDMKTENLKVLTDSENEENYQYFLHKPTLMTLKGMRPEKGL